MRHAEYCLQMIDPLNNPCTCNLAARAGVKLEHILYAPPGLLPPIAQAPGFITGDWSVEYPPIAEHLADAWRLIVGFEPKLALEKPRDSFPAAAMRDSAF